MAIPHAISGQPIALLPLSGEPGAAQTVALFKTEHLEVMRLVLPKGKAFPPHQVSGDITVQCLKGLVDVPMEDRSGKEVRHQALSAGELLYLAGGVRHGLVGLEDAVVLVTIVLHT